MNQSNWAKVYSTQAPYKAEITKDVLENEGVQSVVVDKQDTAYGGVFGEVELYVRREDVIKAKHIIAKKEL